MSNYRKLQFTDGKTGEVRILPHEEAREVMKCIVTTHMVKDAIVAGIPVVADGGQYKLL